MNEVKTIKLMKSRISFLENTVNERIILYSE
jgi:hypothetical protein